MIKDMMKRHLPKSFFAQDTHRVATQLLGKILVHQEAGRFLQARIVETESYVGQNDKACHAAKGRTPRTETMFGEAGFTYIYMIYGMYYCLNIVTEKKDFPAAVLIRAAEPIEGIADTTNGPGKLCRAMHITKEINGENLVSSQNLFLIDDGYVVEKNRIVSTRRIGVEYAGKSANLPWRYYVADSPFVSRRK